MSILVCLPRRLNDAQQERATRRSVEVNPANASEHAILASVPGARRGGPRRLALVVGRRWPKAGVRLSVQFLDAPSVALRRRILAHMNAWSERAEVAVAETRGVGEVRIARLDDPPEDAGYWSYVGTEILGIEDDAATMNLEGFTMRTPEAEFRRVVRHEAGHTLGFDHEHLREELVRRIDRRKAIAYFRRAFGWSAEETEAQVLTPLSRASLVGTTEADPDSIMCYQVPGSITRDGKPIPGGADINPRDHAFAARIYPREATPGRPAASKRAPTGRKAAAMPAAPRAPAVAALHGVVMADFLPPTQGARRASQREFARVFASWDGARVTAAMRLRAGADGEPTGFGRIIRLHERIRSYTNRERGSLPREDELVAFGADLFETLFTGDVRRLYDEARARRAGGRLDLVLTSMIPWIAEKPWDFAWDPSRRSFLATGELHFIRNVLTAVPADPVARRRGALRILVACAQPLGFGLLGVAQEVAVLRRGFAGLVEAGAVQIEVMARATPESLHARLVDGGLDVLHFVGHGAFDPDAMEGALVFEDEHGAPRRVPARALAQIICGRGLSMVFLNACESGTGGRADFNRGVAQALVAHGVPALAANQYSVLDASATVFARQFYLGLARGLPLGECAREARIAVGYGLQGESIDWAVPVVYARDPNLVLCERAAGPAIAPPAEAPARAARVRRGAPAVPAQAIAVWDLDAVFPALDDTLRGLDAAQSRFRFRRADLSPPLDAWDLARRDRAGRPALRAGALAGRIGPIAGSLGAGLVLCLTRHRVQDPDGHDVAAWWPAGRDVPLAVLSFAGLPRVPAAGPFTDRALAHRIAGALAVWYGAREPHRAGARSCPLWANPRRELAPLLAAQRFDARCREALARAIPADLPALEAVLSAFD
ncbi:MAG: CHAT domain-containing protein [Pseudomonadota bacterium]